MPWGYILIGIAMFVAGFLFGLFVVPSRQFQNLRVGAQNVSQSSHQLMGGVSSRLDWRRVAIWAGIICLVLLILPPLGFLGLLMYFKQGLKELRLTPNFAWALALTVTSLCAAALWAMFSWRRRRRIMGRIILLLTVVAWLVGNGIAWQNVNFLQSGQTVKWYANTPDGIRTADVPGNDEVWNVPRQPMTPEVVHRLKEAEAGVRLIQLDPLTIRKFFDANTGEPLVFYTIRDNGCIVIYNRPAFDQETREELKPITTEIIARLHEQTERGDCVTALNEAYVNGQLPQDVSSFEAYVEELEKFRPRGN